MRWYKIEEEDYEELIPDGEIFVLYDSISDLLSLAYFRGDETISMAMFKHEADSQATHFLRLPELPRNEV